MRADHARRGGVALNPDPTTVRLRRMCEADAPFILELLTSRGFLEGVGDRGVNSLAAARRYIVEGPLASYRENGFALEIVEAGAAHEPVGICGLVRRSGLEGPDLGYAFLERAWGRGYARTAGVETLRRAVEVSKLRRVWAVVKPSNAASIAVLRRLTFVPVSSVVLAGVESLLFAWTPPRSGASAPAAEASTSQGWPRID